MLRYRSHDQQPEPEPLNLTSAHDISVTIAGKTILERVSLVIEAGKIVTIIGPNGAGKSTLLRALLGLIPVTSGRIEQIPDLRIGYMPQQLVLNPLLPLTVLRFLQQACTDPQQIRQALDDTGLDQGLLQRSLHGLSGGELQRLLLSRALLRKPHLLVLDEPVQGVDLVGQTELYRLIASLRDRYQCGILLVSHDLHLVMAATDTVICLNQHICCQGHPEQVSNDPAYLQLFGRHAVSDIAIYTHHHDHNHDLHGNVVGQDCRHD